MSKAAQLALATAAVGGVLAFVYSDRAIGKKPRPDLVHIPGDPIIGNLRDFLMSETVYHDIVRNYEKYGLTYTLTAPLMPRIISTGDPKNVEYFLKSKSMLIDDS
jgi:hypothetical protein